MFKFTKILVAAMAAALVMTETVDAKTIMYLAGDSTCAKSSNPRIQGWGEQLQPFFDPNKIEVSNQALGGRSTRTFLREGHYAAILATVVKGDYIVIEFGHNDRNKISDAAHRGPIQSATNETVIDTLADGTKETVLTFGGYLRNYIAEAKSKGAVPILSCSTPRGAFNTTTKTNTGGGRFIDFAKTVAAETGVLFVDHNAISAASFTALGQTKVDSFFSGQPKDFLHTNSAGAVVNAEAFVAGLKCLTSEKNIQAGFSEKGLAVNKATASCR